MRFNSKPLLYIIGFTILLVISLNWNYELIRKIFFVLGIISTYMWVLSLGLRRVKKEKAVPCYIS